ncbi:type VI secretion system baseplate subunit TssE [Paraglaciecola sp.]|uniref:type VI secretion system baseplate subunit TssE n=1 Tax=Paraglaciecola sp. TaxID=1920173 RepID=UPI003EF89ACF
MINEKSLLERIDDPDFANNRSLEVDVGKASESIIVHLRNMFNVRQGSVMTLDDYGMPDFNDLVAEFPNAIKVIRSVIRDIIRKYEPRLKEVSVQHVADSDHPLELYFQIKAKIQSDDQDIALTFETIVGDSGKVRIRN